MAAFGCRLRAGFAAARMVAVLADECAEVIGSRGVQLRVEPPVGVTLAREGEQVANGADEQVDIDGVHAGFYGKPPQRGQLRTARFTGGGS